MSSNWKEGPVKGSGFREFAFGFFLVEKNSFAKEEDHLKGDGK